MTQTCILSSPAVGVTSAHKTASLGVCFLHFCSSQVRVVRERSTGDVFALKVMKKAHILQQADVSLSLCLFQGTVL